MLTNLSNLDIEPPSLLFISILGYTQITSIVIVFVLLFCSALISGAEVAFFSLNAVDVEDDATKPSRKLIIIKKLLLKPKKLLATILVANNFINIAIVLLFDSLTAVLFSGVSEKYHLRFILEVGVVTFLILLFGEILPKIYESRNRFAYAFCYFVHPKKIRETKIRYQCW
jgi:putative hemolysin